MLFALGFVFLFTIGGLKIHLALPMVLSIFSPWREERLSYFTTICWELLTIILLEFYLISVIKYNFEKSAGNYIIWWLGRPNILVGSSETRRSTGSLLRKDIVQIRKNSLIFNSRSRLNLESKRPFIFDKSQLVYPVICRSYSSNKEALIFSNHDLKAVKVYDDFKESRINIVKEQRDKSGVYCLINKVNGHAYVGSSMNLASRMRNYLNKAFLKSKQNANMPITKALLKYDHSNFSLLILEYVELVNLTSRETFYITHMIPYYNILKEGYSSLGYIHTEETKKLLSELAKNRTHSDKTKGLIARAVMGENNPFYNKNHSLESKIRMIEANSAYSIYVYNSFKQLLVIFPSVLTLAKLIKSNHSSLVNIIKEQTIFRGEWFLRNIPYNISDTPKIADWSSKECEELIMSMNNNSHIRKAVFVYDINGNFLVKYDGVMVAQRALNISHSTIKNYAKVGGLYKGYRFSYERLIRGY
jgi:group I intron endonuclease